MTTQHEERIARIRKKVREERTLVAALDAKVADLKAILKPASDLLNDVEFFFLGPDVLQHPARTEAEWAYWLGHAEAVLSRAVVQREYVADLIAKYGPDARIVRPT